MPDTTADQLLQAILMHVPFDGWSGTSFHAAIADSGVDRTVARALFPRGAVDLALLYHRRGDDAMEERIRNADLSNLRFRDKIGYAIRARLDAVEDKEAVRRGTTLFALPPYAAEGARAIWGTADRIWTVLGDQSNDLNWYSKRATLSGVYSATVLYWLGDDSVDHQASWAFLDRRIDNVMQIEKAKAKLRKLPGFGGISARLAERVRAPTPRPTDVPGPR